MLRKVFQRAGAVAVGTGIGQGLTLVATPLLTRLYSPAEFGTLALLVTVSNVSMTVACLRYDVAIPSADEEDARGLLAMALLSSAAIGFLGALATIWAARQPWAIRHARDLLDHPAAVGCCIMLVGFYQALGAWLLRSGRYGGVAALRVVQGGGFGLVAALRVTGLLWGHVLSFAVGLLALPRMFAPRAQRSWWQTAARYRDFPLLGLPGALLDVVGYSVSVWVIAGAFGRDAAGEYSQIQRLIGAPLMLVSLSLGQVMLKQTADVMRDRSELGKMLGHTLLALVTIAFVAILLLAAVGQPALSWILGPRWHVERETVVLVALAVFARACVSPLSVVLLTLRRFRLALIWQVAYFCSAALLMPWVAARVGFAGYIRFYAGHELAFYSTYLLLIRYAVGVNECVGSSGWSEAAVSGERTRSR